MLDGARVIVVVPAFRERARIARVIEAIPAEVDSIIVVDDASDDDTAHAARAVADARVIVVRHEHNRGVGAAIVTGYRRANEIAGSPRDAFVVMAGDGQMDPRDLPTLVAPIARGDAGYAKGDRFAWPGALRTIPRTRYIGGRVLSALTSAALAVRIRDSQCGYTALSREACARLDLDALWPRFGYPNDLLAMLVRAGIDVVEVPIRPVYPHTKNKLGARHVPIIVSLVARAALRRVFTPKG